MFHYVKEYARWSKKALPHIPTICGGVHPTIDPEDAIAAEGIDMICIGEGEGAIKDVCDNLSNKEHLRNIQNIWYKDGAEIYKNPVHPLIGDLDTLPFPDRDIFNYSSLDDMKFSRGVFLATRGCPYDCSYCVNHQLRELYKNKGKYIRFRSVENVLTEIEMMIKEYSIKIINFDDDILALKKDWLEEFSEKYPKRIGLPFYCNARVELIDHDSVQKFKNAGCVSMAIGLESGSEEIRRNILNRKMSNEDIVHAFSICKANGIKTASFNMVGIPFETPEDVIETIRLNGQIKPNAMQVSIFYPYPHTKIYETCLKNEMLKHKKFDSYFEGTILKQKTISEEQTIFFFRSFNTLVFIYSILYRLPSRYTAYLDTKLKRILTYRRMPYNLLGHTNLILGKIYGIIWQRLNSIKLKYF